MKKISIFVLLLVSLTTGFANAQTKKVAVVTFYINKQLDVTQFGGAAQLAVSKLSDDPAFDLTPLLKHFHEEFFENYSKSFPFEIIPEDQVLKNEAYKAYVPVNEASSGILSPTKYLTPIDGYHIFLRFVGHANERNMPKIFPQADGVMDVTIKFELAKIGFGGMGVVKINATASLEMFNKNGDQVFYLKQEAKSKPSNPLIGGVPVMTPEKLYPLYESAMEELMIALRKDLPKLAKKADAKL